MDAHQLLRLGEPSTTQHDRAVILGPLVERAAGVEAKVKRDGRVDVMLDGVLQTRRFQRAGVWCEDAGLVVGVWPGEQLREAQLVYADDSLADLMCALDDADGWTVEPQPQLAFWRGERHRMWLRPQISLPSYLSTWAAHIESAGSYSVDDLRGTVWPLLSELRLVGPGDAEDLDRFERDLLAGSRDGKMQIRAGLAVRHLWLGTELAAMSVEDLVEGLRDALVTILDVFDESRLPTDPLPPDEVVYRRASRLRTTGDVSRPPGNKQPARIPTTTVAFERDRRVVAFVLEAAAGRCEACGEHGPFLRGDEPFLEVHHVIPLFLGGEDTVENAAAVCPNCHRACHYSDDASARTVALYDRIDRLVRR